MSSKVIGSLATLLTANADQLFAEFRKADGVITRNTTKWQGTFKGGLKLGIGIAGAQAALGAVNSEIRYVIQNIERIPGIPAETVTSITEAREEFQSFRHAIDGAFAKLLQWGRLFAQSVGAGAAMLFGGASADDVGSGLSKLPSPDEMARSKDPAFDEKLRAAGGRLRDAQNTERRAGWTPAAQFNDLRAESDRLKTYAASPSINSIEQTEARIKAEQRAAEANAIYRKAQDESNRAMERWLEVSEKGRVSKMSDSEAASILTEEMKNLERQVVAVNEQMLTGGAQDISLLTQRTALYEQLRQKQEQLNPILERQRETMQEFANQVGSSVTGAFEDMIMEGRKFSDVLKGLEQDLIRIILRKTILEPLANFISGGIMSIFGFADGGRPPVGVPSLVGERGPELFVPDSAGTIIPNHALKGSGGSPVGGAGVTYAPVYNIAAGVTRQEILPILKAHGRAIVAAIADTQRRGAPITAAFA